MNVRGLYNKAGYEVETVFMNMEFDKIKGILLQFDINTNAAQEHMAEVDQKIRVLKE